MLLNTLIAPGAPQPVVPLKLARQVATVPGVVPAAIMLAAGATLLSASRAAHTDLRAHPGRRGNPARRERAAEDADLAERLLTDAVVRWRVLRGDDDELLFEVRGAVADEGGAAPVNRQQRRALDVEALPALGAEQWSVLVTLAVSFQGSLKDLVMVVRSTVPDDEPLELEAWQRWTRRARWREEARQAEQEAATTEYHARWRKQEARRYRELAEDAERQATSAHASASRARERAGAHRCAPDMTDNQLAVYEASCDAGMSPATALARARVLG